MLNNYGSACHAAPRPVTLAEDGGERGEGGLRTKKNATYSYSYFLPSNSRAFFYEKLYSYLCYYRKKLWTKRPSPRNITQSALSTSSINIPGLHCRFFHPRGIPSSIWVVAKTALPVSLQGYAQSVKQPSTPPGHCVQTRWMGLAH